MDCLVLVLEELYNCSQQSSLREKQKFINCPHAQLIAIPQIYMFLEIVQSHIER